MVAASTTEPVTHQRCGLRRVLVTSCVTETTSWGILHHAFPVLAGEISADTGWSPTWLTAAFSLGLVVSAVLGIGVVGLVAAALSWGSLPPTRLPRTLDP
ncbi:hypothetical protein GCM10009616_12030 [Microlunatus lacustris]